MLYCASIDFSLCIRDDGFVLCVATKRRQKGGETKTEQLCDWRLELFLTNQYSIIQPITITNDLTQFSRSDLKHFFSFVSLSSHWPRPPHYRYAPWPKLDSDSDFHSENGPWYNTLGKAQAQATCPTACCLPAACDFGPSGTRKFYSPSCGV